MDSIERNLLKEIADIETTPFGAYNIRENGEGIDCGVTENIDIVTKTDKPGIDIIIKENTKNESVHIPVIITQGGLKDVVYNDFYVGKNAEVVIVAGCGIHNSTCSTSQHDGIHRFFLEENAKVKYIEKHYGEGDGTGEKIMNPQTVIDLKKGASFEMESVQIKGVDSTIRETIGYLAEDANLVVTERIMTHGEQFAKTIFEVKLNGENASTHVTSRSVADNNSKQEFLSRVEGNSKCFGHVECDAIIMENAKVIASPQVEANHLEANLIHEAAIGKIAGEQIT